MLPTKGIPVYLQQTNKEINDYYNIISKQQQVINAANEQLISTEQLLTDMDIANIEAEQTITDLDLRVLELEAKNE